MHGSVHDFVVSQTVRNWHFLPTGHGGGALIPTIIPINQPKNEPSTLRLYPRVLDIGSHNINGSMREYDFLGVGPKWRTMIGVEEFIGIDLVKGPDVDIEMDAHKLEWADNSFDLIICLEMLEHDSNVAATIKEAYRVLKPGGLALFATIDEMQPEHMQDWPVELPYNHITEEDLRLVLISAVGAKFKLWHIGQDLFVRIEK